MIYFMISGGVSLDTAARSFKRHRFAFLPSLISIEMACRFEKKTRNLPFTRVSIGDNPAMWDERTLLTWAESDEFACFVPALWAGGPEPFCVTVGSSWVGYAA
jgi:hypothetical protein